MKLKQINAEFWVADQISIQDVAELAEKGIELMDVFAMKITVDQPHIDAANRVCDVVQPLNNGDRATVFGLILGRICEDSPEFIHIYVQLIEQVAEAYIQKAKSELMQ